MLELDICFACQGLWFDPQENLKLTPASVMELFRLLHEQRDAMRHPLAAQLACPHCQRSLDKGFDIVRSGRYVTYRCPRGHGRFSAFSSFMVEKGFVRQLNGAEVKALADKVQVIRCSGCGAPVDIRKENVCSHCRAPIAIIDPDAVQKALAEFGTAAYRAEHLDPNALADTLIANERLNAQARRTAKTTHSVGFIEMADTADLITGGIELIVEFFSDS